MLVVPLIPAAITLFLEVLAPPMVVTALAMMETALKMVPLVALVVVVVEVIFPRITELVERETLAGIHL